MSDWGKGVINDIGWGQGANNDIGWGSIYDKSNAGETLLGGGGVFNNAFIIEVKTDNAGTSNDNQFQFTGAEGDYDVVAKQNDIIVQTFSDLSDAATITFANGAGTYVLEITPKATNGFNRIKFNDSDDKDKPKDVKQWGNIVWSSFSKAFKNCTYMLVTATDVPNLSNVTSLQEMFRQMRIADPDVSNWDTSNITTLQDMFHEAEDANPDVRNWDVSNVTNMILTFFRTSFDRDISNWDVSNVTDMNNMLKNSNLSVENLTACYENWSQLSLQQNVSFGAGNTKYNASGQAGRDILVNTYNWTITDGGQV